MAEIEKTPDLITGDDIGTNVIDHTVVADSFINVAASDPTVGNDTGSGYVVGSVWVNSSSGQVFQAIDVTAESSVWVNQEGDDVNNDPYNGTNYGFHIGGYSPPDRSEITTLSLSSPHAGSDYGEITRVLHAMGLFTDAGKTKGFVCGGHQPGTASLEECATFSFTAPVNATEVGELHTNCSGISMMCQTPSLGYLGGGVNYPSPSDNLLDNIQSFATVAPHTAADVSEMATAIRSASSSESPTHGYSGGGSIPGHTTNIHRFQKGTSDNSVDVGELAVSSASYGGGATDGRGGFGYHISGQNTSGVEVDTINKFPFASPTAGSDVGEYTRVEGPAGKNLHAHQISSTTHFFATDYGGSIWKGSFTSPATTSDVGEMATVTTYGGGTQY